MRVLFCTAILMLAVISSYAQNESQTKCKLQDLAIAAALGDPKAQFTLGAEFYSGEEVPQDYGKAATMWRLSGNGGIVASFNNLGYLTYYGRGVKQNFAEGLRLWRIAAEQGLAESQFHIGYAYSDGKYLNKNHTEAYAWLITAKHYAGQAREADILKMVEERLAEIRGFLTLQQLTLAQRRAKQYIAKYGSK